MPGAGCWVLGTIRAVPVDRALEAGAKVGGRREAELLLGARHVEHPPRLTVGLGRIEHEPSLEAGEIRHELGQIPDTDFEPGTDVDWLRRVVPLGRQDNGARAILDEQELTRRVAGAPALHL